MFHGHGLAVPRRSDAEDSGLAESTATETALVPAWWFIEITNIVAIAERKGRITPTQSDAFIADLSKLGIERDDEAPDRAFAHLLALCRTHGLTSYDAIYRFGHSSQLAVARLGEGLRKIAKKLGVGVLG